MEIPLPNGMTEPMSIGKTNRTLHMCRSTGAHMTNPVIGTPWQKLDRPVSEEAIEGMDKYWRAPTTSPSARSTCVATR